MRCSNRSANVRRRKTGLAPHNVIIPCGSLALDQRPQPVRPQDHDIAAIQVHDIGVPPDTQLLVDALPGGCDEVAEIALRQLEVDPGAGGGTVNDLDELGGVFVGNLRRSPGKDELEIVRPHVARGEPALWRVRVADTAFESFAGGFAPKTKSTLTSRELGESPRERLTWLLGALGAGIAFGMLLVAKWRGFRAVALERRAQAAALIPLSAGLRAALGGTFLGFAVIAGGRWDEPTLVGALVLGAMACATLYAKPGRPAPRGPGQWLPLSEADAFAKAEPRSPGRFLDASTWPGAIVLGVVVLAALGLHLLERLSSPYRAVELLVAAAALMPVFLTGRAAELPVNPGGDPRGVLKRLLLGLRRRGLRVVPLARLPLGSAAPDELRLLIQPRGALAGLTAIEVGADYAVGLGGVVTEPYVLVRVREGSSCLTALSDRLAFQRGRKPEERVALLRPKLPTVAVSVALVTELVQHLTTAKPELPQGPTRAPSSRGKGASPSKPARVSSPAHAI